MRSLISAAGAIIFIVCLVGAAVNGIAIKGNRVPGRSIWDFDGTDSSQRRHTAIRNFAIFGAVGFGTMILLAIVNR